MESSSHPATPPATHGPRLLVGFIVLLALSAGLGALSADFTPPPPAWTVEPAQVAPAAPAPARDRVTPPVVGPQGRQEGRSEAPT